MKKALLLFLTLTLTLSSCSKKKEPEVIEQQVVSDGPTEKEPVAIVGGELPDFKFSIGDLQINQHMDSMDLRAFTHFGEFYTEDFRVYRLDRIDYLAEAHFIDDINLYFIDSMLVRVQAYLREDKSNEFIRRYGKAKIAINDYHNRKLLEDQDLLIRVNGKTQINENLDNFTLKWKRESLDIDYSVNKKNDSVTNPGLRFKSLGDKDYKYRLTLQTKDFKNQMAWVRWEGYKKSRGLD